jgi:hypothetical protein
LHCRKGQAIFEILKHNDTAGRPAGKGKKVERGRRKEERVRRKEEGGKRKVKRRKLIAVMRIIFFVIIIMVQLRLLW